MNEFIDDFNTLKKLISSNDEYLIKMDELYYKIRTIYNKYYDVNTNLCGKSLTERNKYDLNREIYKNIENIIKGLDLIILEILITYNINKNLYLNIFNFHIITLRHFYYKYLKYIIFINSLLKNVDYYEDCKSGNMNNAKSEYVKIFQEYNENIIKIINILEKISDNITILCVKNSDKSNFLHDIILIFGLIILSLLLYILNNSIIHKKF